MRQANPELKDYCFQKHGLDFSMVDMRWGVTDEATNDHSTEEICLREIHNCQRVGLGPTFVVRYVSYLFRGQCTSTRDRNSPNF